MESKGANTTAAIITLVLGLAVGGGIGYASAANMNKDDSHMTSSVSEKSPNVNTKAADLRSTLVSAGTDHMNLTYTAVASALGGAKSADADQTALIQNGKDIAAAVGSIYGSDAQATFEKVWTLHLTQFVNYAVASSKGDENGKQMALSTIDSEYTKPLAAYLAKANPKLPEDALYSGLKEHVDMTAVMIDDEAKGDFAAANEQREMGVKHLEGLMTTLADGIVKQYPDKF